MSLHSEKDRLKVAEAMARDYLEIHRGCTYKDLTEIERENMAKVAILAGQVIGYEEEKEVAGMFE